MVHTHGLRPQSTNYPFCGGYIAVEFFLILSGYFATKYILNPSDNNSVGANAFKYTVRQVKKVLPAVVVTVFFNYVAIFVYGINNAWVSFGILYVLSKNLCLLFPCVDNDTCVSCNSICGRGESVFGQ